MQKVIFVILVAISLTAGKCAGECVPEQTKCDGGKAYVCNSAEKWEMSVDCSTISTDLGIMLFHCCMDKTDGLHSCLPLTSNDCASETLDSSTGSDK